MANNILLFCEDDEICNKIKNKLVLLRESDTITECTHKDIKNIAKSQAEIAILYTQKDAQTQALKNIDTIKNLAPDTLIILFSEEIEPDFLYKAYDAGIYDSFTTDNNNYEITIKLMNCLRYIENKKIISRQNQYLFLTGQLDIKTNLYKKTYLKTIFPTLIENPKYRNGIFMAITLDDSTKTKVSINRMALAINKNIRKNDIAAIEKNGMFYITLFECSIENARKISQKIQQAMGDDLIIRSGVVRIGFKNFEELEKISKDCLLNATQKNIICSSTDNINENWLDANSEENKTYKFFQNIYQNKIKYVIEPTFYKMQKEYSKIKKTTVVQYSNTIESVFCLKSEEVTSELTIRFNGYSAVKISITHSGLNSPEDTKHTVPIKSFTSKELTKALKQLKEEHMVGNK